MASGNTPSKQQDTGGKVSKEIAAFLELANAFGGESDLNKLLEIIKNEATRLVEADRASIFLVDNETKELPCRAKPPNIIRRPRNIIRAQRIITLKRPSTMSPAIMRRRPITPMPLTAIPRTRQNMANTRAAPTAKSTATSDRTQRRAD